MRISRLLSFFVLLLPLQAFAEVYDVSTTAELREALASAAEAGDDNTIRLAAGTYSTQDDGEGAFTYLSKVDGSLTLSSETPQQMAILDGAHVNTILEWYLEGSLFELVIENLVFRNAEHGALLGSYLESLTITNSSFEDNVSRVNSASQTGYGGAVYASAATVLIRDSVFRNNSVTASGTARQLGGAVYLRSRAYEVTNNLFEGNRALDGGAIYVSSGLGYYPGQIHGNRFNDNVASIGGAIYSYPEVTISNNSFRSNRANAGAATAYGTVDGNLFEDHDPGVSVVGNPYKFANNILLNNGKVTIGANRQVSQNLFSNTLLTVRESTSLANNIFLGADTLVDGDGAFFLDINNNYIDTSKVGGSLAVEGSGNIFEGVNLGFVNAEEGDYRLTSSSGLIDAGTTDPELAYITDYDYTGTTARVIGASIDIGPYEYDGEAPPDSDGDGINDNIDNCPSIANEDQADFDSDGEGDACDSDDDNDGTNDEDDAFPFDDTESLDTDGDGIGNNEDEDDDGDGTLDDSDPQPTIANVFAIDSDGDGVADSIDDYPTDATKQFSSDGDFDGDGFTNDEEVDYCSNPFDKNSQPDIGGLSLPLIQVLTEQQ